MSTQGHRSWICDMESLEQRTFLSATPVFDPPPKAVTLPAVVVRKAATQALIINHNSLSAVSKLSATTMSNIVKTYAVYFAHASVGENILTGLQTLRSANSSRYGLRVVAEDDIPPAKTSKGRIYESNRGNPSWQEKVDLFAKAMSRGWASKVNIAINKFCFIDPDVTLQYYAISNSKGTAMSQLEAKYPKVRFVYTTIPLTTDSDADNIKRNKFNIALRAWAKANKKILLDIADIEAFGADGKQATFNYKGTIYQRLNAAYSEDGGHLNAAGSKRQATAWYALAAGLLNR